MKTLLLASLLAVAAWAQTTTVTEMVNGPDGNPTAGQASIRISAPCQGASGYVGMRTIVVKFTASIPAGQTNNFSAGLVPNDTCVPAGTSYSVSFLLVGGSSYTETWVIPTSTSPIPITCPANNPGCVHAKVAGPIPPPFGVGISGISAGGVANGFYCIQVVNGQIALANTGCPGSGSGGTGGTTNLSWGALSSSAWSTLTAAQWIALSN